MASERLHKAHVRFVLMQTPIVLLLLFFLVAGGLSWGQRGMAVATVAIEAILIFEMLGMHAERLSIDKEGIVLREILARKRIPWSAVAEMRQAVVSPMDPQKGNRRAASKLFLVKLHKQAKVEAKLQEASVWWAKSEPMREEFFRSATSPVKEFGDMVAKQLDNWLILWKLDYRKPQGAIEEVKIAYLFVNDREKPFVDAAGEFGGKSCKNLLDVIDLTYPSFYQSKHRKGYDIEDVWESAFS